jgi:SNF2 family DNA or RNA helicase
LPLEFWWVSVPNNFQSWKTGDKPKKPTHNLFIEGKFLYYSPTFFPSHEVKEFGGRWDKNRQLWRLPKLTRIAKKVMEYDPDVTLTPEAKFLASDKWELNDSEVAGALFEEYGLADKYSSLYPYQQSAVKALVSRSYHGAMLALTPGLGKTPTAIVAADQYMAVNGHEGRYPRILVVAPLALVHNWAREIERWAEQPDVLIAHQTPPGNTHWTVTNYDTILERVKNSNNVSVVSGNINPEYDLDWDVVILDESVLLKNRKSKRTMVMRSLAHKAKRVWLLSGAPVTRDNSDIWAQFNIMEPEFFSSFWTFANEFCVVVRTPWSQGEIQGSRKGMSVRGEFPELMFIRNQEEVFDELPEYIYQDIELSLTKRQQKAHDDLMDQWFHELEDNRDKRVDVAAVIAQLTRLMQVTSCLGNLKTTGQDWPDESCKADYICDALTNGEIELPALVWVHHRPGAAMLHERLLKLTKKKDSALYKKRVELVVGGTKGADAIIEDYKAGKVDVLLLGITVGRFGHSLAITRTVVYFDKTWDSDAYFQSLHRVAGARAKLTGYRHRPRLISLRCRRTIDDYVELNLAGKLPSISDLTGADLMKLLRGLGEDHVGA